MQRRWRWTGLGLLPLAPLAWLYRSLASAGGGPMTPTWGHLTDWRSPTAWVRQWTWIDPISLARKVELPFLREPGLAGRCLAPAIWLTAAALIWTGIAIYHRIRTKTQNNPSSQAARAWGAAALVCFLAGALGPDSLGPTHGHYLPQRGVLTALALIPPFWDWSTRSHGRRLGAACLVVAWVMQSLWIWDYARMCQDRVEPFLAARPWVGTDQRVASLVMNTQSPFRANPMLHVDCALGWGDGRYNVIYGNYETLHYYFPVQFRPEVNRPPARVFEDLALLEDEAQRPERLARWQTLLDDYDAVIDILIIWDGRGSEIPVLTPLQAERWGQPVLNTPRLKVYQQQPSRKRIVSQ